MGRVRFDADGQSTWRRADRSVTVEISEGSNTLVLDVDTDERRLRVKIAGQWVANLSWSDLRLAAGSGPYREGMGLGSGRRLYPLADEQVQAVLAFEPDVITERLRAHYLATEPPPA